MLIFFDNILQEPGSVTLARADAMLDELAQIMKQGGNATAAVIATFRGPTRSAHGPSVVVVTPSVHAHIEKIGSTVPSDQSDPDGATTPSALVRGPLKVDHA